MEHEDILLTLAEVSVAFAGFSGVVAVFGRRDPSTWSFSDRMRFFSLVQTSLSTLIFCVLPFGLFAVQVAEESVWGALSMLYVLYVIVVAVLFIRRLRAAATSERAEFTPIVLPVTLAVTALIAVFNVYNVVVGATFGPFLVGLIWLLVQSSFLFARMLVSGFGAGSS